MKLGELFCGPGGMSLGASKVLLGSGRKAFRHVWANDIDSDTCKTYLNNIPDATPTSVICESVRDLDFSKLSPIDCLAFGFPCNDFSVVGERLGIEGKFGPLYMYGVAALEHFQPACFVAENVSGLTSANDGNSFVRILRDLMKAGPGYTIVPHLYKAEEYNVPQKRRRILIVGIRTDLNKKFRIPSPTTAEKPPTVRDALLAVPIKSGTKNNELTRQSETVIERLKYIKPGENAFTADLPEELMLQVKGAKISQIYKRLQLDEPSYTVTGSGGGGTHIYHWCENRALTNRERARLQGFPDDFTFFGSKESVRKQIGMAVPPPLASAIFQALYNSLNFINYSSIPPNIELPESQLDFVLERRLAYGKL